MFRISEFVARLQTLWHYLFVQLLLFYLVIFYEIFSLHKLPWSIRDRRRSISFLDCSRWFRRDSRSNWLLGFIIFIFLNISLLKSRPFDLLSLDFHWFKNCVRNIISFHCNFLHFNFLVFFSWFLLTCDSRLRINFSINGCSISDWFVKC